MPKPAPSDSPSVVTACPPCAHFATAPLDAEYLIDAAKMHGETSEPDHEVGDLQVFVRRIFAQLTPAQIEQLGRDEEMRATLAAAFGL